MVMMIRATTVMMVVAYYDGMGVKHIEKLKFH